MALCDICANSVWAKGSIELTAECVDCVDHSNYAGRVLEIGGTDK